MPLGGLKIESDKCRLIRPSGQPGQLPATSYQLLLLPGQRAAAAAAAAAAAVARGGGTWWSVVSGD